MTSGNDDDASLSGAYALHALNADEARMFEAHLLESQDTRNEVTELADTAVLLGLATAPVDPPAALKASIMAQLDSVPQLPREPVAEPGRVEPARFGPAQAKTRGRWFTRPMSVLAAAAAAVVLVVGGGVLVGVLTNNSSNEAADQLAAIYAAEDSHRAVTAIEGGGSATLVWSGELHSAALIVDGLAALPSDKTYELWYMNADGARSAGTFSMSDSGSTWRVLDGPMDAGDTVGVTVEPSGGSTTPTTDPVIVIESA